MQVAAAATLGILAAALWWRRHPSACPYGQRFWLRPPHPLITRARLRRVLEPKRGERILEVGPGTGHYSGEVAEALGPPGCLELLDQQNEMLKHTVARLASAGIDNVAATVGDALELPFETNRFDAAFLVAVLGEVPDQERALRELARVVRPGGRLVVGELFGDPHWVRPRRLIERAEASGMSYDRRLGTPFGYFARFRM
ncbi:class I SAM-dependent methyltransferase [Thermoleophilia bacterium SCSIO 60948]|nr:class I SAM-dependent methyltransferase [Thermoleophilia bacterium SCSIO 60948]